MHIFFKLCVIILYDIIYFVVQIDPAWPLEALSGQILCPFDRPLHLHSFRTSLLWGTRCYRIIHESALNSAIFPVNSVSFYLRMAFSNQDMDTEYGLFCSVFIIWNENTRMQKIEEMTAKK